LAAIDGWGINSDADNNEAVTRKLITMKNKIIVMMTVALLGVPALVRAQPDFNDDTTDAPIDGGLTILLAAGAGYGIRRMSGRKDSS